MQHINPKLQNSETQVTTILEYLVDEKELSPPPTSDLEETVNATTLKSVEFDEFSNVDEYLREPEETLEVSSHEPNITIAQNKDDEVEKEIGVISERPMEPQIKKEEDQPMVLVKPLTLPSIFVTPYIGVEVKEHSQIFYTTDTFMSDDHDATNHYLRDRATDLKTRLVPVWKQFLSRMIVDPLLRTMMERLTTVYKRVHAKEYLGDDEYCCVICQDDFSERNFLGRNFSVKETEKFEFISPIPTDFMDINDEYERNGSSPILTDSMDID
ncbi:hypothetical protein Syun_016796 [Stephania yunnanensis]|uniref:Uncharacterized protein n=1 Tax=Stephania yunnanensis TaxID=152371 RepID=A0AAP0J5W5_9MAGN